MKLFIISIIIWMRLVQGEDLPTLFPVDPFDPNNDAARLFDAIDGWGTDEDEIVNVLCERTSSQRDVITNIYNTQHGNLAGDLKSDLTGSFQTLSIKLTHSMTKFLSLELFDTMARAGTDEVSLTEIIMSRSNQELKDIGTFYMDYYGHTLASDIESDTVRPYQTLCIQMAEGLRDESDFINMTQVQMDVFDLYEGGPAINGTNDRIYVDIFTLRSFTHINEVAALYQETYGTSLRTVVTTEFADEMGSALASILEYSRDKAIYFSGRFHNSIIGMGTNDQDVMRLTISRCETDLGNIKSAYQSLYGTSLSSAVASDTSGSYGKALLALID